MWTPYILRLEVGRDFCVILPENQISAGYRYIERNTNITILQISSSGNKKNAPTDLAAGTFRYHNCWARLKTVDMLVPLLLDKYFKPQYLGVPEK
jgi:hypothetical protein